MTKIYEMFGYDTRTMTRALMERADGVAMMPVGANVAADCNVGHHAALILPK